MDDDRQSREAAFNRLFDAHYGAVRAYAWRRHPDLADDIAAETFAIVWRDLERVPREPLPWLIGIARNVRLNLLRTERRRAEREARDASLESATVETTSFTTAVENRSLLHAALERLSERDREVLLLSAWEGLQCAEIARALGSTRTSAAVRLHRARRRLSAALSELEAPPTARRLEPRSVSDEC